MPNLKPTEIILLLLVVVLLFGAKRLPDAARGLGRSLRIFKAETKGLINDDEAPAATTTVEQVPTTPPAAIPPAPAVPPVVTPPVAAHPVVTPEPAPAPPVEPGAPAER